MLLSFNQDPGTGIFTASQANNITQCCNNDDDECKFSIPFRESPAFDPNLIANTQHKLRLSI